MTPLLPPEKDLTDNEGGQDNEEGNDDSGGADPDDGGFDRKR